MSNVWAERDAMRVIILRDESETGQWVDTPNPATGGSSVPWDVDGGWSNSEYGVLEGGDSGSF